MASTQEIVDEQLENLVETDGIEGAAVSRQDGLLIASNLEDDINEDQVGAMTASTVGSGDTAADSVNLGEVKGVTVEASEGKIVSMSAGEEGIMTVIISSGTSMDAVRGEIAEAGSTISEEL